jgi:hypothetical protein
MSKQLRSVLKKSKCDTAMTVSAKPQESRVDYKLDVELVCKKIFPDKSRFEVTKCAGFLGSLIDLIPYGTENPYTECVKKYSNQIWAGESVMRGPLILDKALYEKLGGFNIRGFFLGYDDSDLCYRAVERGFRVAYVPLLYSSPLELGSTRKKRKLIPRIFLLFMY